MPVIKDSDKYDQLHTRLVRDLLLVIKDELDAADLDHDEVHDLTANIAMAIAEVLDGSSPVKLGGQDMVPFLAFASEEQRDRLIVNEHGSYMHEVVDSLFESMEQEEDFDDEEEEEEEEEDDYEYEDDDEEEEEDEEEEDEPDDQDDGSPRRH